MICTVCQTNYDVKRSCWRFERGSEQNEGIYIVEAEVFTPKILHAILEHALQNGYAAISVDAYFAEYTSCDGCQRLTIQLNKEREALLNLSKYEKITYYESF